MVHTSSPLSAKSVSDIASHAAAQLSRVRAFDGGARLTVPVMYPSGAMVALSITDTGAGRYLVTDNGGGAREAEMMGASNIFVRHGRRAAQRTGVRFDSYEFFEIDASVETLPGFIAIVADASRLAVQMTSDALAERLDKGAVASIAERLKDVFGSDYQSDRHEVMGASTRQWKFDAIVERRGMLLAFNAVTPSPVSVSSAYMKFDDVRRLDNAPVQIAYMIRRAAFSHENIVLLNRTAKLFDASKSNDELVRLVA